MIKLLKVRDVVPDSFDLGINKSIANQIFPHYMLWRLRQRARREEILPQSPLPPSDGEETAR